MTVGFTTVYNGRTIEIDDLLVKREFFSDGGLWTWGENGYQGGAYGTLGDGTTTNRSSPGTTAGSGINWRQVEAAAYVMAGIKTDGTLWTWGRNWAAQLGDSSVASRSSPGTTAGGGTNWMQVSCGYRHIGAVKTDGTLWMWGVNSFGELGDNTAVDKVSPVSTVGGGGWKQVAVAYSYHTAAVKTDGTLWTWGLGSLGVLGNGATTDRSSPGTTAGGGTNWVQVATGYRTMAAVKSDGTLWTWGDASYGVLGTGNTTSRSSPGTTAGGGTNWKQVTVIYNSNMAAIKTDGTLWTWGNNSTGQLGDGTTTSRSSPGTTAGGGTNWKQVDTSTSSFTMAAVKTDGTLWTWGSNSLGQLGTGNTTGRSSPGTTAGGGTNWKQVSSGDNKTAAVTDLTI